MHRVWVVTAARTGEAVPHGNAAEGKTAVR